MNPAQLLEHFDRISEAPDAVGRLRRFILDLAVRGKLVEHSTNWYEITLGEIGEWGSGGTPSKSHTEYYGGDIPWLVIGDLNEGLVTRAETYITEVGLKNSSAKIVKPGTILIAMYGSIGKLGIAGIRCATNQAIAFCVPDLAKVSREFLVVVLKSLREELLEKGHGVAQQNISQKILKAHPVKLPPLTEQNRIVAKVDELMALCDQLEAAKNEREARRDRLVVASLHRIGTATPATDEAATEIQSATPLRAAARFHFDHLPRLATRPEHIKQLRQTILNLAVRGCLVPQDFDEEPAAELLKRIQTEKARLVKEGLIPRSKATTGAPILTFELPPNWQAMRFDDVCNLVTSGSRGWAEYYADSGPKFVRAQNIRFGRLRLDDLACVNPPTNGEGKRTHVTEGDLLIVITGAGVTNPALMDRDLGEAYVSQHVALIKPSSTAMSRWLLLCLMSGPGGRDELVERAYGAGKPGLNLDNIRTLNAPLPSLAEQHRIVAKVDELMALCDQLEAQLNTTQAASRHLLEAVLHEALTPTHMEVA